MERKSMGKRLADMGFRRARQEMFLAGDALPKLWAEAKKASDLNAN